MHNYIVDGGIIIAAIIWAVAFVISTFKKEITLLIYSIPKHGIIFRIRHQMLQKHSLPNTAPPFDDKRDCKQYELFIKSEFSKSLIQIASNVKRDDI